MFDLLIFFAQKPRISDYRGGNDPLLVFIAFALITLLITTGIIFLIWQAYRRWRFQFICKNHGLTGQQIGIIRNYCRRFAINDLLGIISSPLRYDRFSNTLSRYFGAKVVSDEQLISEIKNLEKIRKTLRLFHNPKSKRLRSSRGLEVGKVLTIDWRDDENNQLITFESRILEINDLFLGITIPDKDIAETLQAMHQPELDITFRRPKDASYTFESKLIRAVTEPKPLWYIYHSRILNRGLSSKPINVPASALCTRATPGSEEVIELDMTLTQITQTSCIVTPKDQRKHMAADHAILLSFELLNQPISCRGIVTKTIRLKKSGKVAYKVSFTHLEDEIKQTVIRFLLQLKKSQRSQREAAIKKHK